MGDMHFLLVVVCGRYSLITETAVCVLQTLLPFISTENEEETQVTCPKLSLKCANSSSSFRNEGPVTGPKE